MRKDKLRVCTPVLGIIVGEGLGQPPHARSTPKDPRTSTAKRVKG